MRDNKKEIRAVVRFCPNYLFHLLASARVQFDSDYADRYGRTVEPEDIAFINKHKKLFAVGTGDGGQLTALIAFPACFMIETKEEFEEFFSLFEAGFRDNNFKPFINRYRSFIERLNIWFAFKENDLLSMKEYRQIISAFGKIVLGNINSYEKDVWSVEQPVLEKVAEDINRFFEHQDVIERWEKLVGIKFKLDVYNVILCSAIKNGPNANSIAYDAVIFYHGDPLDKMTQFISHEVGTHLLIDEFKKTAALNKFDFGILYCAYESLAKFYNRMVLDMETAAYRLSDGMYEERFMEIYRRIYSESPQISPGDILVRGAEEFNR